MAHFDVTCTAIAVPHRAKWDYDSPTITFPQYACYLKPEESELPAGLPKGSVQCRVPRKDELVAGDHDAPLALFDIEFTFNVGLPGDSIAS